MERKKEPFTKEQLEAFSKPLLIEMVVQMQAQMSEMNQQMIVLTDRISTLINGQYGRHTEKSKEIDHQMEFCFNEAEITIIDASEKQREEPSITDINPSQDAKPKPRKPHKKGKLEDLIKALPEKIESYTLKGDELQCSCGGTFNPIGEPEAITRLEFTPASFQVIRGKVYSYKCGSCGKIVRADHPLRLFEGSVATPSLLAGIMTAKYTNGMPFYRLERAFADHDAFIRRPTMARWMIRAADVYFSLIYERLKEELLSCEVIHADETTVKVSKDGRPAGTNSFIWVYTKESDLRPVVIFEYQKTREHKHAKEFLKDYQGWLCCDGYEAYHSLGDAITVCGCWAHARRHYANAVKGLKNQPERARERSVSEDALKKIGHLFHKDNQWKNLPPEEHLKKRQEELKPEVEAYFSWVKSKVGTVPPKSETGKGLSYSINQEKYLLGFLSSANAPMDNSEAERKIRNFVIARKNFVLIDSLAGADASAILFSMSETAKANNLKPYDYFKYLLEELPKHMEDDHRDMSFLDNLLPWSENLPPEIRKPVKNDSSAAP